MTQHATKRAEWTSHATIRTLEIDSLRFASDSDIALPVMVSSHERSGTHFVINSIASNSAFRNDPHLNYDTTPLGSFHNFHDSQWSDLLRLSLRTKMREHHQEPFLAGFFLDNSGKLLLSGLCKTIYIARNPLEVMMSYHRFVNYFPWYEGPRAKRPLDFLKPHPKAACCAIKARRSTPWWGDGPFTSWPGSRSPRQIQTTFLS